MLREALSLLELGIMTSIMAMAHARAHAGHAEPIPGSCWAC